ncbi:MAG: phosphoribosylaminoimidazolesuccinocarboxamide synthase [Patescibacteria group bacterium]|nr:phosphoribosylaminoimidazolesuccinocarboxamide synthase [Patescibacteria group bacterium]MDD5294370.1 phosphoribosylaminoimidazolesuccinocarboxamide synthase [Patescibacteria group bacterium]MDD5554186.1 phosphoribosylaminoimidazolesuccinocarboxamide synthase [Patescibacteria group bacterium]
MAPVLLRTDIPVLQNPGRGKVRDIYDLGGHLLIVTTDRISAFDCILPTGIPGKGGVLNTMSAFWFEFVKDIVPSHLVTTDIHGFAKKFSPELVPFLDQLKGRSMIVRKAQRIDVECIVRGYLSGSGWKEYKKSGTVCGIPLPAGLVESDRLPQAIFTPSTKAENGHDENVSFDIVVKMIGQPLAEKIRDLSLAVYEKARAYAETKGIIIADTKFEFGEVDGQTILIDEILSPDSSRFWPKALYRPGGPQMSFDKQYVRDWLEAVGWNKEQDTAPELPPEIVAKTTEKYQEALKLLVP